MVNLEQSLYGLATCAAAILWYLCILRNRTRIWGWLELWCRANKQANIERQRVMREVQGVGCLSHTKGDKQWV